ncbi:hypothetical protein GCM10027097_73920 [Amycolatopsis acidiphila]
MNSSIRHSVPLLSVMRAAARRPSRREHPMSEAQQVSQTRDEALVEEELLVEEVSIDGMCGVY